MNYVGRSLGPPVTERSNTKRARCGCPRLRGCASQLAETALRRGERSCGENFTPVRLGRRRKMTADRFSNVHELAHGPSMSLRHHPSFVGRQGDSRAFAQQNCGRAIGLPQIHSIAKPTAPSAKPTKTPTARNMVEVLHLGLKGPQRDENYRPEREVSHHVCSRTDR
jgi:hypothetical protein